MLGLVRLLESHLDPSCLDILVSNYAFELDLRGGGIWPQCGFLA